MNRFGHLHPRAINALESLSIVTHREPSSEVINGFYRLHLLDKLEAVLVDLGNLGIVAYSTRETMTGCILDHLRDEEGVVNFLEALAELQCDKLLVTRLSLKSGSWSVGLNQYQPHLLHISFLNKL